MTYQKYSFKKLSPEQWKQQQEDRTQAIINKFKTYSTAELLEKIAHAYVTKNGSPSDSWSLMNRLIMTANNTEDARTFLTWKSLGRNIKPNTKAFYIRKPTGYLIRELKTEKIRLLNKKEKFDPQTMEIVKTYFGLQAEHRVEDTEGNDIVYENEPKELPPLMHIAKRLGIKVSWAKFTKTENGYYDPTQKKIVLKVYDWNTFFHELSHAIEHKIKGFIKGGQDTNQEITAQMSACIIGSLYGIDISKYTYQYIMSYSKLNATEAIKNIDKNMNMIKKILDFIFENETKKGDQ